MLCCKWDFIYHFPPGAKKMRWKNAMKKNISERINKIALHIPAYSMFVFFSLYLCYVTLHWLTLIACFRTMLLLFVVFVCYFFTGLFPFIFHHFCLFSTVIKQRMAHKTIHFLYLTLQCAAGVANQTNK